MKCLQRQNLLEQNITASAPAVSQRSRLRAVREAGRCTVDKYPCGIFSQRSILWVARHGVKLCTTIVATFVVTPKFAIDNTSSLMRILR